MITFFISNLNLIFMPFKTSTLVKGALAAGAAGIALTVKILNNLKKGPGTLEFYRELPKGIVLIGYEWPANVDMKISVLNPPNKPNEGWVYLYNVNTDENGMLNINNPEYYKVEPLCGFPKPEERERDQGYVSLFFMAECLANDKITISKIKIPTSFYYTLQPCP